VLIVDDHVDTVEMLETILTLHDFDVVSATNVPDALALASNGFDAICTDLSMPGVDGFDFIRQMRKARSISIPIVVVSGQLPELVRDTLDELGCCRFLSKPCDPDELVRTLRRLIATCVGNCAGCTHLSGRR
jgi:CheY-like chemotaxis protein